MNLKLLRQMPKNHPVRRRCTRIGHTTFHAAYFGFVALEHSGTFGAIAAVLLLFTLSEVFSEAIEFLPGHSHNPEAVNADTAEALD